jgi:hypothetical protein
MRHLIWMTPLVVALVVALSAAPAYAWHCPKLAADAKAVIAKAEAKGGNSAQITKAQKLLRQGEEAHAAGRHNEAMDNLANSIHAAVSAATGSKGHMMKHKSHY